MQSIASVASWRAPASMSRRIARRSATSSAYAAASSTSPSRPASCPCLSHASMLCRNCSRSLRAIRLVGPALALRSWAASFQKLGCRPQHLYLCGGRPASQILLESGAFPRCRRAPDCWCRGALRTAQRANSTGRCPPNDPNINLTETTDLACHTPLGMTSSKSLVHKDLGHSGTLCTMTKMTPNFS